MGIVVAVVSYLKRPIHTVPHKTLRSTESQPWQVVVVEKDYNLDHLEVLEVAEAMPRSVTKVPITIGQEDREHPDKVIRVDRAMDAGAVLGQAAEAGAQGQQVTSNLDSQAELVEQVLV
jgi:hypothetical protein